MSPIDGYAICKGIRKINSDIPIIIMSGYQKDLQIQELLEDKNIWFIGKPFAIEDISKLINQILESLNGNN